MIFSPDVMEFHGIFMGFCGIFDGISWNLNGMFMESWENHGNTYKVLVLKHGVEVFTFEKLSWDET